jgi:hypothetical protein
MSVELLPRCCCFAKRNFPLISAEAMFSVSQTL